MSLPVRTTLEADAQIRSIDAWWRANRAASPNLFADELASSFDIIGLTPGHRPALPPLTGARNTTRFAQRFPLLRLLRANC